MDADEVGQEIRRLRRALAASGRDLERHGSWRQLRREADLLATWLHLVKPRMAEVTVTEYLQDGSEQQVTIALEPELAPSANLQRRARAAAKGERGEVVARERQERLRGELARREAELAELLAKPAEPEAATALASEAVRPKRAVTQKPEPDPLEQIWKGAGSIEWHLRPRIFHAADGTVLLVGRTSAGNDMLTVRIARGNDWFFHVAGTPGSHVILRWQGTEQPPREAMLDAAALAVHFSKMKEGGTVAVTYCQRKHVTKPKGARAGLVYVNKAQTLTVRRDPARLARLLGKQAGEGTARE